MTIENNLQTEPKRNFIIEAVKKYGPKALVVVGAVTGTTSLIIVGLAAMEYVNVIKNSIKAKPKD